MYTSVVYVQYIQEELRKMLILLLLHFFNVLCLHDDVDMMMPYENVFVYGWLQYVCILIEAYIFCVVIIYCVVYFHVSTVHARHDIQFK